MTWDNDPEPKWYRYNTSLGQNEVIHEYLDRVILRKFIPQKFTFPKDHPEEIARKQPYVVYSPNKTSPLPHFATPLSLLLLPPQTN